MNNLDNNLDNNLQTIIYHLLTDTGYFYVKGKKYPHYNYCIDLYLDR